MIYTFFSLDVYEKLSIRSKELLIDKKEYLKTFSLGNIPLSYNKKYLNLYNDLNSSKVCELFTTLINYIKYNDFKYNKQVMAYLYGMIINYNLSINLNPYLIYKGGLKKYTCIKNYLDNYIINIRKKTNPYHYKIYKDSFNINYLDKGLIEVIDFSYKQVFNVDNYSKIYFKSIKKMKKFYKIFRYDRFGIKKIFYSIFRNKYLSYHTKGNKSYLNIEHNKWYNPTNKRVNITLSFPEIYLNSLNSAFKMIDEINKYIYYDKRINLDKVIGNKNYITGREIGKEKELKFFEN